jgi:hypothetical protein
MLSSVLVMLSYVLVACHPAQFGQTCLFTNSPNISTTVRGSKFQRIREKTGLSKTEGEFTDGWFVIILQTLCSPPKRRFWKSERTFFGKLFHYPLHTEARRAPQGLWVNERTFGNVFSSNFQRNVAKIEYSPFEKYFESAFPNVRSAIQNLRLGSRNLSQKDSTTRRKVHHSRAASLL